MNATAAQDKTPDLFDQELQKAGNQLAPIVPVVDREALKLGIITAYDGRRKVQTQNGDSWMHRFVSHGGLGVTFDLWGTAELNQMLVAVAKGEYVGLRYIGRVPNPARPGQEMHKWTAVHVRDAVKVAETRKRLFETHEKFFRNEYDKAVAAERERQAQRAGQSAAADTDWPGSLADDDIGF